MRNVGEWIGIAFILLGAGCGAEYASHGNVAACCGSPRGMGATQGGVQDFNMVRELVAQGIVPPPEAITVEGMFSEHDLPLDGPPCNSLLCLRGALGIAPTLAGEPSGWMQVGMSSSVDPDNYDRPTMTLIATVDVSGSMGWDYSNSDDTPGAVSRELLHALSDQLTADDRFAIVIYSGTASVALPLTAGNNQEAIDAAIDKLASGGSTNMEEGMKVAYDLAKETAGQTQETRLVLFTDVQPNVGQIGAESFVALAESGAESDIGLTVLGLGIGLGPDIMQKMSSVRGGNAFTLYRRSEVADFMADNWPWFASPIAYDLSIDITPSKGYTVANGYGFPSAGSTKASLDVATVFLSKKRGGLLLEIDPPGAGFTGFAVPSKIRYTTPNGTAVSKDIQPTYDNTPVDDRGHYYEQASVGKTVALAVLVSNMRKAAEAYQPNRGEAVEIMTAAAARIRADAEAQGDPALEPEVKLADALLALMEEGASQEAMYGR